jgi:hypothetical protein
MKPEKISKFNFAGCSFHRKRFLGVEFHRPLPHLAALNFYG